jgi:hypothetical protein
MDQPPDRRERSHQTAPIVALVFLGFGVGVVALDFIALGGTLLSLFAALAAGGGAHYLLWGHALTQEVAPEREALLHQEENGEPPLTQAPADAIQDLERMRGIQKK